MEDAKLRLDAALLRSAGVYGGESGTVTPVADEAGPMTLDAATRRILSAAGFSQADLQSEWWGTPPSESELGINVASIPISRMPALPPPLFVPPGAGSSTVARTVAPPTDHFANMETF